MASWKNKDGQFRHVSASDFRHNYFVEVCRAMESTQFYEQSWDELEDYDRVLSSELTEKEVMRYAVQR